MKTNPANRTNGIYFGKDDKFVAWCGGCQGFYETVQLVKDKGMMVPLCGKCRVIRETPTLSKLVGRRRPEIRLNESGVE